ncbi:MAG: hypothetical protein RLZ44_1190 [Pseudomonadota bacterium]
MTAERCRWLLLALLLLALGGCGVRGPDVVDQDGAPSHHPDLSAIPDAQPRPEPRSRYGNPESYEVFGRSYRVLDSSQDFVERGIASWYGTKFHGRRTSSGAPYDMYAMTAAHKHLPLPTYARVTNLENGRSIVVKINDRGPFHPNRVIDLSYAGAYKLGMLARGTARVEVRAIDPHRPERAAPAPTPAQPPDIFLQAGAFASEDNARRMRERLEQSLARSVRVQPNGAAQSVFRVQVGPLNSVEQADALMAQLERLGVNDAHVVID